MQPHFRKKDLGKWFWPFLVLFSLKDYTLQHNSGQEGCKAVLLAGEFCSKTSYPETTKAMDLHSLFELLLKSNLTKGRSQVSRSSDLQLPSVHTPRCFVQTSWTHGPLWGWKTITHREETRWSCHKESKCIWSHLFVNLLPSAVYFCSPSLQKTPDLLGKSLASLFKDFMQGYRRQVTATTAATVWDVP